MIADLHYLLNGNTLENLKIAVALRTARTALGWSQQEFSEKMGVAKSTIARIETLEMTAKADFLTRALRLFKDDGVLVDLLASDSVTFVVESDGLAQAQARLQDERMRRKERQQDRTINILTESAAYQITNKLEK